MADGRIPLRELVTNQNRGQLDIILAAGTSIQLENLKTKVLIGPLNPPIIFDYFRGPTFLKFLLWMTKNQIRLSLNLYRIPKTF